MLALENSRGETLGKLIQELPAKHTEMLQSSIKYSLRKYQYSLVVF